MHTKPKKTNTYEGMGKRLEINAKA